MAVKTVRNSYISWREIAMVVMFLFLLLLPFSRTQKIVPYCVPLAITKNVKFAQFWEPNWLETLTYQPHKGTIQTIPIKGHINSTARDVVISVAFETAENTIPGWRSLIDTSCMATRIMFIDRRAMMKLPLFYQKFFNENLVEVINIGYLPNLGQSIGRQSWYLRFYLYYDFLRKYINDFDRILVYDAYDTLFQFDPFTESIHQDKIYLTAEPLKIAGNPWIRFWIEEAIPHRVWSTILDRDNICCGLFLGGIKPYLAMVHAFLLHIDDLPVLNLSPYAETGIFEGFIHGTDFCERTGICTILNHSQGYLHLAIFDIRKIIIGPWGRIQYRNSRTPIRLLHHVDRKREILLSYLCSNPAPKELPMKSYFRLSDESKEYLENHKCAQS